jgi:hypothetical protein
MSNKCCIVFLTNKTVNKSLQSAFILFIPVLWSACLALLARFCSTGLSAVSSVLSALSCLQLVGEFAGLGRTNGSWFIPGDHDGKLV